MSASTPVDRHYYYPQPFLASNTHRVVPVAFRLALAVECSSEPWTASIEARKVCPRERARERKASPRRGVAKREKEIAALAAVDLLPDGLPSKRKNLMRAIARTTRPSRTVVADYCHRALMQPKLDGSITAIR